MPVLTQDLKARKQGTTLKAQVTHRILEIDGDITTLKERREWAWLPTKEITAINKLIKLLEASIKELEKHL